MTFLALLLAGCRSELPSELAETCPDPAVTWADVEPIFLSECVECHSTALPVGARQGAPAFTNYDNPEVARVDGFLTWTMIVNARMPPVPLEEADARLIWTWLSCDGPP